MGRSERTFNAIATCAAKNTIFAPNAGNHQRRQLLRLSRRHVRSAITQLIVTTASGPEHYRTARQRRSRLPANSAIAASHDTDASRRSSTRRSHYAKNGPRQLPHTDHDAEQRGRRAKTSATTCLARRRSRSRCRRAGMIAPISCSWRPPPGRRVPRSPAASRRARPGSSVPSKP